MLSQNASGQLLILHPVIHSAAQLLLTLHLPATTLPEFSFTRAAWIPACCSSFISVAMTMSWCQVTWERKGFFFSLQFQVMVYHFREIKAGTKKPIPIVKSREKQMHLCQLPVSYSVSPLSSCKVQASKPGNSVSHRRLSQLTSKSVHPTGMSASQPNLGNFSS